MKTGELGCGNELVIGVLPKTRWRAIVDIKGVLREIQVYASSNRVIRSSRTRDVKVQ